MTELGVFPETNQEVWLAQIQKELRDTPIHQAGIELEPGITTQPFLHPSSQPKAVLPLWSEPIDWLMNADIDCQELTQATHQVSNALQFGATSITLKHVSSTHLAKLLSDVHLQMVGLGVQSTDTNYLEVLEQCLAICAQKGLKNAEINAYLYPDTAAWLAESPREVLVFFDRLRQVFPHLKAHHFYIDPEASYADSLTRLLAQAQSLYDTIGQARGKEAELAIRPHFTFSIKTNYFAEVARLRAFRILWFNFCQSRQFPLTQPLIHVRMAPQAYTDQVNTNLIRATTMAMSGVVGGCTSLTVLPFDHNRLELNQYGPEFSLRIARNVQHLLKLESGMHLIADSAAGSYFVEDLTNQIAEKAWANFVQ
jgi:methylmalonyl-CoA mutase